MERLRVGHTAVTTSGPVGLKPRRSFYCPHTGSGFLFVASLKERKMFESAAESQSRLQRFILKFVIFKLSQQTRTEPPGSPSFVWFLWFCCFFVSSGFIDQKQKKKKKETQTAVEEVEEEERVRNQPLDLPGRVGRGRARTGSGSRSPLVT